nr:uncharacterized protein LOC109164834 [Ipomoea trifida]
METGKLVAGERWRRGEAEAQAQRSVAVAVRRQLVAGSGMTRLWCIALCWCIWRERNEVVWNQKQWQPAKVIMDVQRSVHAWQTLDLNSPVGVSIIADVDETSSSHLPVGVVSVHTDAAVFLDSQELHDDKGAPTGSSNGDSDSLLSAAMGSVNQHRDE